MNSFSPQYTLYVLVSGYVGRWWWGGRRIFLKMFAGETKFVSVVTVVTVFRETGGNSWLTNLTKRKIQTSLQT